jgi:hypothetical protein
MPEQQLQSDMPWIPDFFSIFFVEIFALHVSIFENQVDLCYKHKILKRKPGQERHHAVHCRWQACSHEACCVLASSQARAIYF